MGQHSRGDLTAGSDSERPTRRMLLTAVPLRDPPTSPRAHPRGSGQRGQREGVGLQDVYVTQRRRGRWQVRASFRNDIH